MTSRIKNQAWQVLFVMSCMLALQTTTHAQPGEGERAITLRVGEQKSISAKNVRSFSEGTPGVADVRVTKDQSRFVLVGKSVGTTSLLLIKRDGSQQQYSIRVVPAGTPKGLGARENIRLDLYFVLVNDRYGHQIGLNWSGNIGGGVGNTMSTANATIDITGGGSASSTFQIMANTVLPSLDLAQSKGWAKLYRQTALITANGTEAVFSSGGEVNTISSNALTVQLLTVPFGTRVTVLPRYDAKTRRIELEISAEVSDLDSANGTSEIPGRIMTNVQTLVNLELGQSVSLAGIRARSERRLKSGIPGLAMIPFVGALFGSFSKEKEDLQAYMFVVPSIIEPVSLDQRSRIDEAVKLYNEFRGGVDDVEVRDVAQPPYANTTETVKPSK